MKPNDYRHTTVAKFVREVVRLQDEVGRTCYGAENPEFGLREKLEVPQPEKTLWRVREGRGVGRIIP